MPLILPSPEISHRCDFSLLCNARGYVDAVEVGTDLGRFAAEFLSRFDGNWLYCVDPYEPYPEIPHDRILDGITAANALAPYHGRFRFVRGRSPDVAPWVRSMITPQFVYIDGAHEKKDVAKDIRGWFDVLAQDGILAGHDFDELHPGVMEAVQEFAEPRGLTVFLTHETDQPKSWYFYKTEPETYFQRLFTSGTIINFRCRS